MSSTCRWFFSLLFISQVAFGNDKVVLQLKWEHEFQFAGYYAALWQGYYADEGLDVTILPATSPSGPQLKSPVEEVSSGRADFAIGALDILTQRDKGTRLKVLAPVFQRSPHSVFVLPGTPLDTVADLAKLTVATPIDDFTRAELEALFHSRQIDQKSVKFVDDPPTVETLLSGKADAIATYSISARVEAAERGVELKELTPSQFGLDFYGDTLFTHERVIKRDPDKVERFLRASLKGWEYALNHKKEVATRITQELPRHLFSYADQGAYNQAFANIIENYMAYPYIEIGHNNRLRWERMVANLRAIGVIQHQLQVDDFLYDPQQRTVRADNRYDLFIWGGVILLFLCSFYYGRHLRQVWLIYLVTIALILAAEQSVESQLQRDHRQALEVDVLQQLNSVAANLSGVVNRNLAYLNGMAAHVSAYPEIDQMGFERYSEAIFRQKPLLVNLAAAPDLVIRYMYPLKGNEKAVGLDYRKKPDQLDVVMRVKESGGIGVAGPIMLVQGGVAFVARIGVTAVDEFGEPYFWGILSAPFAADELYKKAGLFKPELSVNLAIRGRDALGSSGDAFFGDASLFDDPESLKVTIRVGDGAWQLAAQPKNGWDFGAASLYMIRGAAIALAVLLLLFLVWQRRQLEAQERYEIAIRDNEELLREVSTVALINGWTIPVGSQILRWSSHTSNLLGLPVSVSSIALIDLWELFDKPNAEKLQFAISDAQENGIPFDIELYVEGTEDGARWIRWIGKTQKHPGGYEITGAIQDISERKKFNEVVERQANYDLLTGLPNRSHFYDHLKWSVSAAQRNGSKLALLFIDLDKFKPVNDTYGHTAGDMLLKAVARRLQNALRETDTVARISGDEFTVILPQVHSAYAPIDVAEKLLTEIRRPYDILGRQIYCGASIGISLFPDDSHQVDDLISKADYAMFEVKRSGRNGCQYFTHEMQARSDYRHNLYTRLQTAISERQLYLVYQPIVDLSTGRIVKCEALIRWQDEDGRQVSPAEFIALAEETSLVNEIDRFVLEEASLFVEQLSQQEGYPIAVSVNVSPRVFASTDQALQQWLALALEAASRVHLTVEITERLLIEGTERAQSALHALKDGGARIAIDDFGTGYSSLSYLTRLPIDYIKIDRTFVKDLESDTSINLLIDTIISLGKNLQLKMIAEGVEDQACLDILRDKGCEYAQGYYLGKPMSGEAFSQTVREQTLP